MQIPFFDLTRQNTALADELNVAMQEVIQSGRFLHGDKVRALEQGWGALNAQTHGIAVGNGTDALTVALMALGVTAGDEVVIPAMSWVSTASCVTQLGAKPVFVDVDSDYLMNLEKVEAKITAGTKAVVPVHLYGQMVDMVALSQLCKDRGLAIVEDAAQAHGALQQQEAPGAFSDAVVYSFYPTKNLGALGDAGMILTRDAKLAEDCRRVANQGGLQRHEHTVAGMTSRMDELQAAILLAKMPHLKHWNQRRRAIAATYSHQLSTLGGLALPHERVGNDHVYHQYVIRCKKRDALADYLREQGVETDIHYPVALPFLPVFQACNYSADDFSVAHRWSQEILSLPIFPELENEEVDYICTKIKAFFARN
ncbi:dTDP-4-amino-4,6-dideoxygalactose transaminase [Reichenbachiella agariperforans]|uniref:dTDP-4-amino-4,6-dideoxygalactose transaminase n=1 Tax=Reichenbachiella agariperforans TaxID=156994 RepID=A0A1M6W3Z1_REIAG|nr:DegT/DnrJ/EryC1/StrS family aminotransferase [Reichenbachiella agariperforans]SHK88397.1 dTDP-4-amino-4,6-dideoxygalactose transaminase [Reichenbachiella agariperforans]